MVQARQAGMGNELSRLFHQLLCLPMDPCFGPAVWETVQQAVTDIRSQRRRREPYRMDLAKLEHLVNLKQELEDKFLTVSDLSRRIEAQQRRITELESQGTSHGAGQARATVLNVSQASITGPTSDSTPDPRFVRFHKMLTMHVPEGAVRREIEKEGLNPDAVMSTLREGPTQGPPVPAESPSVDPRFVKYQKMLKMHIPEGAVRMKIQAEGFEPDLVLASILQPAADPKPTAPPAPAIASASALPDPRFAKYQKMLKMHIPEGAVRMKIQAEGLNPDEVLASLQGSSLATNASSGDPHSEPAPPRARPGTAVAEDPRLAKYQKMLKMHIPEGAVRMKMQADGLDPSLLSASATRTSSPK